MGDQSAEKERLSKSENGRSKYCRCRKKNDRPGYAQCTRCLERGRENKHRLKTERLSAGLCVGCGVPTDSQNYYCNSCSKRRISNRKTRSKRLKQKAVEYSGGECSDCGFTTNHLSVYEFHHEKVSDKENTIGKMIKRAQTWDRIRCELDKCVMLCANCHRIRHSREE